MADLLVEPIWDELQAERDGRAPAEFEGHESWDSSPEAIEAEARGRAEAESSSVEWLGWDASKPRDWGPAVFPAPELADQADDWTVEVVRGEET